jgi:uncharacterized protein YbbC (DUF1343 family)
MSEQFNCKYEIVQTGLESFIESPPGWIKGNRLGLLSNPASVDRRLFHARELISDQFPGRLAALFAPQHGFFAEKQDNMIESDDIIDPLLKIPVFSLYGKLIFFLLTCRMLERVFILLFTPWLFALKRQKGSAKRRWFLTVRIP